VRPVNLIPEGERRRHGGAGRTGPLAFIVVGALVIALAGVMALVVTSDQVSERESELASLKGREVALKARADRLAPFAEFDEVKDQRTETISELADSRFDWSRVLHELSLVMPRWVLLTGISGSAGAGIGGAEGGNALGSSIKGPSLSVAGCARSQTRVAQMIAALRRIDGVTRVGLGSSGLEVNGKEGSGSSGSSGGKCSAGYAFTAIAAFDGAPLPVDSTEATTPVETSGSESTEGESGKSESGSSSSGSEEAGGSSSGGSTGTSSVTTKAVPPKG